MAYDYKSITQATGRALSAATAAEGYATTAENAAKDTTNKAKKVDNPVKGNLITLTAAGNPQDAGISPSDLARVINQGSYYGWLTNINSNSDDALKPNSVVWVNSSRGTSGMPENGSGFVVTMSNGGDGYIQTIYYAGGTIARRFYMDDGSGTKAWQAWEWISAPMRPGVEYRLARRYNGAVCYTKLVEYTNTAEFGSTESVTDLAIPHGVEGLASMAEFYARCGIMTLPYCGDGESTSVLTVGSSNITLRSIKRVWAANTTWRFHMVYTKS